jgi:hypothetical protein
VKTISFALAVLVLNAAAAGAWNAYHSTGRQTDRHYRRYRFQGRVYSFGFPEAVGRSVAMLVPD